VDGDPVEVGELERTEPERRPYGRIELAHRPTPERLDPEVEGTNALDGAVGDLLCEPAVACVEGGRGGGEGAVGIGVVLEDTEDDLIGRPAGRRYRRPRSHSS
jgi:hypothetical protein